MTPLDVLHWLLLLGEALIAGPILYLSVVTVAALAASTRAEGRPAAQLPANDDELPHFAVIVPAHDEEPVLGKLLANLTELNYPPARREVIVVADNCADRTAEIARAAGGALVYEREHATLRGKGYALRWIFERLDAEGRVYDAYVVVDADSVVAPDFLAALAAEIGRGARALQAANTVWNTTAAPSTVIRWLALTLMNHVRPLGRNALGFSSTLNGNGMCLTRAVLEQYPWRAFGLTEDRQYYLTLVEHGERVRYVPGAVVRSVMPTTFAQMRTQDVRWGADAPGESRWKVARRLVAAGLRARDRARVEAAMEHITPPLSVLVASCALALIAAVALRWLPGLAVALALCAGLIIYLGSAFYLLRPPRAAYKALLYAPGFVVWKLWVFFVLRRSRRHTAEWVRTTRTAPEGDLPA